jgi:hypothetical protein
MQVKTIRSKSAKIFGGNLMDFLPSHFDEVEEVRSPRAWG